MRIAIGCKAHSGWAVLVAMGRDGNGPCVVERRRIDLIENAGAEWAGQPYHAAEGKPPRQAQAIVERGIAQAQRAARMELHAAIVRAQDAGHQVAACAVLVGAPLPAWNTQEILAVHVRMHQAEGALYPDALIDAARTCGTRVYAMAQKTLREDAARELGQPLGAIEEALAALRKAVGAPWGADQKNAALAALLALAR